MNTFILPNPIHLKRIRAVKRDNEYASAVDFDNQDIWTDPDEEKAYLLFYYDNFVVTQIIEYFQGYLAHPMKDIPYIYVLSRGYCESCSDVILTHSHFVTINQVKVDPISSLFYELFPELFLI